MTEIFLVMHGYKRCQDKLHRKLKSNQVFLIEKVVLTKTLGRNYGYINIAANIYTVSLNLTNLLALGITAE